MGSYEKVIELLQAEIDKIESIMDEFESDDAFITIASYQSGLQKSLVYVQDMKKIQDSFEEKLRAEQQKEWLDEKANKKS